MALATEKEDKAENANGDDDENQNIWSRILSEVQAKGSNSKLPSKRSLIVIGDNEVGKSSLVAKLQSRETPRKGAGLEFQYIDVKDDYRDDTTRLCCWILDGDPHHTGLLKFALTSNSFADSLLVLMVSMENPWSIVDSLKKWTSLIQEHIDRLRIDPQVFREYQDSLVRLFQEYSEPEEGIPSVLKRGPNPLHPLVSTDEDKVLLPLDESTLTENLGIPMVVVVTKVDTIENLEKEHDYREEHFDFIQEHIRKFCLSHGASLVYTSVKDNKNIGLLYRYLAHRIYALPFSDPAFVVDRDCVFVPSGWDNEKKIAILNESITSIKPDDCYEDVIVKPVQRKTAQREAEVQAEEEQAFLMKMQAIINKQPVPTGGAREAPKSGNVQRTGSVLRSNSSTSSSPGTTPKKPGDNKSATANEGVLANFFNSLLTKKSGSPGTTPPPAPKGTGTLPSTTRDAAAAELDRMQRTKVLPK